jgi:hypothetical protein
MPTSTIESANGTRQPQVTKSSPAQRLNAKMARFDNSKPHGTPNCGHDAINPRWFCVRDHSIASSTEPPHSPPTPMPWNTRRTVSRIAPQIPMEAYVGTKAIAKVASPMQSSVAINVALRPMRSP